MDAIQSDVVSVVSMFLSAEKYVMPHREVRHPVARMPSVALDSGLCGRLRPSHRFPRHVVAWITQVVSRSAAMPQFAKITLFSLFAAILAGCGGKDDYTPSAGVNAPAIFAEACQSCHGGAGEGKFGFLFSLAGTESTPEKIARHIAEGGPVMPAFPNLSQEQRMALAAYVKSL
jgi:mono/diheme cytochrome c family protein